MLDAAYLSADAAAAVEALADATLTWAPSWGGAAVSAPVIFAAESIDASGIMTPGTTVRYAAAALSDLREGESVQVGSTWYRIAEPPRVLNDGRDAIARLHRFEPSN